MIENCAVDDCQKRELLARIEALEAALREIVDTARLDYEPPPADLRDIASAALAPSGCICQDQHRRGYCTEPGCPYAVDAQTPSAADRIEALEADVVKWEKFVTNLYEAKNKRIEVLEAALREILEGHPDAFDLARTALAPEQDK